MRTVSSSRLVSRLIFLYALGYLLHVLPAFAQVFVADAVKLLRQACGLDLQRPFGVDLLFADNVCGVAREGGIGQQHQV